jgi:hypothetical protein
MLPRPQRVAALLSHHTALPNSVGTGLTLTPYSVLLCTHTTFIFIPNTEHQRCTRVPHRRLLTPSFVPSGQQTQRSILRCLRCLLSHPAEPLQESGRLSVCPFALIFDPYYQRVPSFRHSFTAARYHSARAPKKARARFHPPAYQRPSLGTRCWFQ